MKMDISRLSDDDLESMFTDSYTSVASLNKIESFECICKRELKNIFIEVTVIGLAGCPTSEEYMKKANKDLKSITISRESKGSLKFTIVPEKTMRLNTNDYMIVYKGE